MFEKPPLIAQCHLFVPAMTLHTVAQWLRHYATNWKVAGSIPDEVIF
jgi:hypothetical protein